MNSQNPVVKLCVQGTECESKGNFEGASKLFLSAWGQSTDDLERCIAALSCPAPESGRSVVLESAIARLRPGRRRRKGLRLLPLSLPEHRQGRGFRHARRFYVTAMEVLSILSDDEYGKVIRAAVERAMERIC